MSDNEELIREIVASLLDQHRDDLNTVLSAFSTATSAINARYKSLYRRLLYEAYFAPARSVN